MIPGHTAGWWALPALRHMGDSMELGSGSDLETAIAEMLLQLGDPLTNEGSRVAGAGNIDRLAVAAEPKLGVA